MFALCFLFPPLAALLSGGIISCIINIVLSLCFYIPGVIHAFAVVNNSKQEKRNNKVIEAIKNQKK